MAPVVQAELGISTMQEPISCSLVALQLPSVVYMEKVKTRPGKVKITEKDCDVRAEYENKSREGTGNCHVGWKELAP